MAAYYCQRGRMQFLVWQFACWGVCCCGSYSIYLLFAVAVSTLFWSGSWHLWLWQYLLFVVAASTFCCGSWRLWPWQYPLFVVAVQVFWNIWCVAGATWGIIFKPYPVTISQQRIMLEQTAKVRGRLFVLRLGMSSACLVHGKWVNDASFHWWECTMALRTAWNHRVAKASITLITFACPFGNSWIQQQHLQKRPSKFCIVQPNLAIPRFFYQLSNQVNWYTQS